MNSRPFYAMTILLIVLVAALQLLGSSQPVNQRSPQLALGSRPRAERVQPQPSLYALRHRPRPAVAQAPAAGRPFVDHHALLSAVCNVSTNGMGAPLAKLSNLTLNHQASQELIAATHDQDRASESTGGESAGFDQLTGRIGFDEFTALVNNSSLADYLLDESQQQSATQDTLAADEFSYETGCGMDHVTGEIYESPLPVDSNVAPVEYDSKGSVWAALMRTARACWKDVSASAALSTYPSTNDLLGWGLRRAMIY